MFNVATEYTRSVHVNYSSAACNEEDLLEILFFYA